MPRRNTPARRTRIRTPRRGNLRKLEAELQGRQEPLEPDPQAPEAGADDGR